MQRDRLQGLCLVENTSTPPPKPCPSKRLTQLSLAAAQEWPSLHLHANGGLSRAGTGQDTSCSTVASLPQGAVYLLNSHPGSSCSGDAPAQFSETLMGQTLCSWLSAHQTMVETRQRNCLPRVSYLWESHETHVPCIPDVFLPTIPSFLKMQYQELSIKE